MEAYLHTVVDGVRVPVVVGGPFACEHKQSVSLSGAFFGETAETVAERVAKGPALRA
jgi:hypothetical protein